MSQQENNNLQDDTEPAQGIGVGGYMAAGAEGTPGEHPFILMVYFSLFRIVYHPRR